MQGSAIEEDVHAISAKTRPLLQKEQLRVEAIQDDQSRSEQSSEGGMEVGSGRRAGVEENFESMARRDKRSQVRHSDFAC